MKPTFRPATDRSVLRHARAYRTAGFTLIELMVVLAIMSIIAVAASAYIGKRPAGIVRTDAIARLTDAMASSAARAKQTGATQAFDPATIIPGMALTPALTASGVSLQSAEAGPVLLFYPDGSSNGGVLTMSGRPVLTLDWLTGEVRRAER